LITGFHLDICGAAVETEEDEEVVEREQKSNFPAVVNCRRLFERLLTDARGY